MTVLDDKLVPAAAKLIKKVGITAILRRNLLENYNPRTGEGRLSDATDITLTISPFTKTEATVDGVVQQAMKTFVAGQGLTTIPEIGWELKVGTTTFRIVQVEELRSGNSIAAYALTCL